MSASASLLTVETGRTGTEISVWPLEGCTVPPLPLMSEGQQICLANGSAYVILKVRVDEGRTTHNIPMGEEVPYYVWCYQVARVNQ